MHFFPPAEQGRRLGKADGNVIAAIAEIALAKPPVKGQKAWINWAKDLRGDGLTSQGTKRCRQDRRDLPSCHTAFKD